MSDPSVQSPFVQNQNQQQSQKVPFYVREWETVLVGALIVAVITYMVCSCGNNEYSYFSNPYDRRSSTQAHFTIDDRVGHDKSYFATQTKGSVLTGVRHPSSGPAVDKFLDFAKVDMIDHIGTKEPNPTHQPSTPDNILESIIRQ